MRWLKSKHLVLHLLTPLLALAGTPDVKEIIAKSVQANHADFAAAPHFNHKEQDNTGSGTKTYQVTMMDGSPYRRLIAVDGKPLPADQEKQELQKEVQAGQSRNAESRAARSARTAKYERGRLRDNAMMGQLTVAFTFTLEGEDTLRGHRVFVLKAVPKPGYVPPNRDCEVLPGMEGKLWIDQVTFQWVRVEAEVLHPVSIGAFLATVNPGTRFELEKEPVNGSSVWLVSHFEMRANAKVLMLFSKNSEEQDKFWDFQKAK